MKTYSKNWSFTRTIDNPATHASGNVIFAPVNDNRFHYQESGVMQIAQSGKPMLFHNKYFFVFVHEKRLDVLFNDNRVFHELHFTESDNTFTAESTHHCGDDVYESQYTFYPNLLSCEQFEVVHRVTGPNKKYTSVTHYCKSM